MKHLIYKEFYLGKKYYCTSLFIFFIISLMGTLTRVSMICGNLANRSTEDLASLDTNTFGIFTYLPAVILFISSCTDGGVIFSDYNSKWVSFCYTAPISEKKLIGVKFISKAIVLTVSFVLSVLNAAVIGAVANKPINGEVFLNLFVMLTVSVIFSALIIPASLRLKSKNAVSILIFAIISIIAIPATLGLFHALDNLPEAYSKLDENAQSQFMTQLVFDKYTEIRDFSAPLIPVIIIAALAISFICSVKILKRREN